MLCAAAIAKSRLIAFATFVWPFVTVHNITVSKSTKRAEATPKLLETSWRQIADAPQLSQEWTPVVSLNPCDLTSCGQRNPLRNYLGSATAVRLLATA